MNSVRSIFLLIPFLFPLIFATAAAGKGAGHFDPKGKTPSRFTIDFQKAQRASLPFEDKRDFEEMKHGFIAAPKYRKIMADAGNVAWDMGKYDFLLEPGQTFDSIHPSLQRQAIINMNYGLYIE